MPAPALIVPSVALRTAWQEGHAERGAAGVLGSVALRLETEPALLRGHSGESGAATRSITSVFTRDRCWWLSRLV